MTPERWAQIEELFHRAAECDPHRRAALLDAACNGDAELQREVEALLDSEERAREDMRAAVNHGLEVATYPLVGETVSHFRILQGLGGGGMGLVYKAEDLKLGRQVALKFLPEDSARNPEALARFEREARSASALEHPNICPIYEFGEHEGRPFLAMQLLQGQTLREMISAHDDGKPPLGVPQLLDLALQIASGLEAANSRGIIHRDIKPANIFVTTQGQAKILDFGLAKLSRAEVAEEARQHALNDTEDGNETRGTAALGTPDPFLSRAGVAMGTAGYMSPEQARGERLDARTDLFSLGLVLYEMAAGQRAFKADTGPLLSDAVLRQTPAPIRHLNRQISIKLEAIINKALEKDRARRYQTAAELCADLQPLKRAVDAKDSLRWWKTASVAGIGLLVVGGLVWFARTRALMTPSLPQIKFRQLTINSPENPVTSQAISPNGKFLAYVDRRGMHVRDIDTGAVQAVPEPEDLKQKSVNWELIDAGWFPDNARFLANAHPASEDASVWSSRTASIWVLSRIGGSPRKLRDNAVGWSVSSGGSLVSFGAHPGKLGERETWLMRSDGSDARLLFDTDENSATGGFLWARDDQHGLYFRTNSSGDALLSWDITGGFAVGLPMPAEFPKSIRGGPVWLPDGRFIYQIPESSSGTNPDEDACNFWEMRIDQHTGKALQKPRRLTTWTGFCISDANATADGKRIAVLRRATQWAVYVADVEAGGTRIANVRRLTLDESSNLTQDWTNDSRSIVFTSNRTGSFAIYRQALDGDQPELISTGIGSFRDTPVSPDGKWLFGIPWPKAPDPKDSNGLMRIPLTGGAPEMVTSTLADDGIFCARPPSSLCVLGERTEDRKQLVFTSIDSVKGRGRELARFGLDPTIEYKDFDVSPDGTRMAVSGSTEGPIHILSLRGEAEGVIPVKFNDAQEFHWTADGKGLYVPDQTKRGTVLLYVDLHGKTHPLWEQRGGGWVWARPSPDGRHLAIENSTTSNNVWVMENF